MERVDFGKVVAHYNKARNDIPASLFESLYYRGVTFEGKVMADIGCGTGVLTRKLKLRKAKVTGVDFSHELIEEAIRFNQKGLYDISYIHGKAEDTGLPSNQLDMVTVLRAWHWFNSKEASYEMKRILKDKGLLIVIDSGFVPPHPIVSSTFRILENYVEIKPVGTKAGSKQRINGFPVEWFEDWNSAGFKLKDFYQLDYKSEFTVNSWMERVASLSYIASLGEAERNQAIEAVYNTLKTEFGEAYEFNLAHNCTVCILKK
ncbi:methyltransferase domain-containing protein [Cytobacillus spongiae]|uniref:class I SAM-dependent methyltransferase n=1 Tax=Cytobacillus spongiae TaxID=2901381 RepID=UPI001F367480|nr:class I SAM-dependent methyltransferase [Cytobacillus spongiae]UII56367.1 methyltransferase domain-containing protein [Cytobacillus spongiae]